MKIINRQPRKTADVSSARRSSLNEFWKLALSAVVLLVALYFLIGVAVDQVVARVSYETEAKIFQAFQPEQSEPSSEEERQRLAQARTILEKFRADPKVPPLPYSLVLVENEMPNAFAFPGGTVGVTTGLLEMLTEEIEVAFVIGHELGHFYNRDHLQGLGRAAGFGLVTAILFDMGSGAESFGNIVNFVFQRSYSQEREIEADRFGLELVYGAYGKVEGTDRLFSLLLEEKDLPQWAYMFATHPSPKERIANLEKIAKELFDRKL
ncbi:MAG: M48 family metallopeptidase [Desulfobacteraceae bacterium]|jgi:Zn-dependent protease with chaperone function